MRAIAVDKDESRSLRIVEVPDPAINHGEVLVDVAAAGVNRADIAQREGRYPPPPGESEILGLEVAGRVSKLGTGVTGWREGDRVCVLLGGGGYAERVRVTAAMLMPVPDAWSFQAAAAIPEVFYTAFVNLVMEGDLRAGESVLVHGGASGVGTAAIQIAKLLGARVFTTAGSAAKVHACEQLGADVALDYREEDFVKTVDAATTGHGVDLVLDMVGGSYLERNLRCLASRGRIVTIAVMGGAKAELHLGHLMTKRARLIGSVLRSRSLEEKLAIRERFMREVWPHLESGALKPIIDSEFTLQNAEAAHARMRSNANIGKIVLTVAG